MGDGFVTKLLGKTHLGVVVLEPIPKVMKIECFEMVVKKPLPQVKFSRLLGGAITKLT
jgi:hypothetical protein